MDMGLMNWLGFGAEKDPVALNDDNFHQEVRSAAEPVLVDVWSPGCAPCDALAPTIKRLAAEYEGRVKVCHLDASAAPHTLRKLHIRGTPTVLIFDRGRVVETIVGLRGQHFYADALEELLEKAV
jgi:thioredoxin-like negative regulator of GroEL